MHRGYIRVYRKKLESDLWKYKNADRVFEFLMLSVTHTPHKYFAYGECIELQPGEYVSSDRTIAERVYLGYQATRTALFYLKSTHRITQRSTHKYSIYSIVNWSMYQNHEMIDNAGYNVPVNAVVTQYQRSDNAVITQKQELKNERMKEIDQDQIPFAPPPEKGNGSGAAPPKWSAMITWDRNKGCFEGITKEMIEKWEKAYPAVNLNAQLNRADEWLKANPTKQKKNYYRFVINWLARSQERGGR